MAYDRYQVFDQVTASTHQPYNNKGVMVVGEGEAEIFPRVADYTAGLSGHAVHGTCGDRVAITGTVQGTIFPGVVAYVGTVAAGTTVYRLH